MLEATLHDKKLCEALVEKFDAVLTRPLKFMEVCGTHTVAIFKGGIPSLLPERVSHLTGPGCPVCVTHDREIALFLDLAQRDNVIIATFGDLMRIPGPGGKSLKHAQAEGARVSIIYSPMDLLKLALEHPHDHIVFPSLGFETTAPTIAATILMAEKQQIKNIALISCHKLVPPALEALLMDSQCEIDAFLLPGHVSMVLGLSPYTFVAEKWGKPAVVSGFEPAEILNALYRVAIQLKKGEARVENAYPRAVNLEGNIQAQKVLYTVFEEVDTCWRGLENIPKSGLALRKEYEKFDALIQFGLSFPSIEPISSCVCGEILKGKMIPTTCELFAKACTPANPVGPCMVSTEGSCAAYFKYSM